MHSWKLLKYGGETSYMIYAGIDIGSITAKAALIRDGQLLGIHTIPTGYNRIKAPVMMTGGVAKNNGMRSALASQLGNNDR